MALFLSSIDENVQKELNKRANRVAKSANELVQADHKHNVERGGLYNRATWIKLIPNTKLTEKSTVKIKPRPILAGGLLYEQGETAPGEPINYGDPLGGIGSETEDGLYTPRSYKGTQGGQAHRPAPGVENIDVKQKGELGSLVEIVIKWKCFTFDQLGELSYYYMRPGASLILEFGWSGTEFDKLPHENPEEAMFNKKDWLNPNMEFYCGLITNFEWSAKDDGSFDCTTTMTSGGSLIVQQELRADQANASGAHQKGFGNMRDFFVEEGGKQFYELIVDYAGDTGKGCFAGQLDDPNSDGEEDGKCFAMASIGWLEDNVFSKFLGFQGKDGKKSMEFRSIEWVPSEDGTSGKYMPTRIRGHKKIVSMDCLQVFIPNRNLGSKITMGEFKEDDGWLSWFNPFDDNKEWHQSMPDFQWRTFFEPMDFFADWDRVSDHPKKTSDEVWSYRNIVMTNKAMRDIARKADTVSEFFEAMFDLINGLCGNMWKFVLTVDDDNTCRAKVLDVNYCDREVKNLIGKTLSEIASGDEEAEAPVYKAYTFPAMGRNSIVKQQSLNMTIPDAAALTTMYGANSGEAAAMTGEADEGEENGGGGSQSDVSMNIMTSMTSGDVELKAKDELLDGLMSPNNFYGSKDPYRNVGDGQTGYASSDGSPENGGQLVGNLNAPWAQTGGWAGRVLNNTGNNNPSNAQDAMEQNSGRFATSDKASDLAKTLKDLEDDEKLPDGLEIDSILPKKEYEAMTNDPSPATAEAFIKKFQGKVWTQLKTTGGGWSIPSSLRDYYWWAVKYAPADSSFEEEGTVEKTNYMLPLELELTLDGIGGVQYGNAWQSEYVPQKYLDTSLFQTTEVNHSVSADGWTTTLKGKMRYIDLADIKANATNKPKKKEEKPKPKPKPKPSAVPTNNEPEPEVETETIIMNSGNEVTITKEKKPKKKKKKIDVKRETQGGGICFVLGTKISMWDGSKKNIEDVLVGDEVLSMNDVKGVVTKHLVYPKNETIKVPRVGNALGSPAHPIYYKGQWLEMKDVDIVEYEEMFVGNYYNLEIDGDDVYGSTHSYIAEDVIASGLGEDETLNEVFHRQDYFKEKYCEEV